MADAASATATDTEPRAAAPAEPGGTPADVASRGGEVRPPLGERRTWFDKLEAWISRLSTKNNFFHRLSSLIWLPFAFRSGIVMRQKDDKTFTAVLPFRRFNKNWYNAMAGAALLGNAEIAGGMYVFGVAGGDFTVVCKELRYRFLRPCFGPAEYRINPTEDLEALAASGKEFNITLEMEVVQTLPAVGEQKKKGQRAKAKRKPKDERAERLERIKQREKRVGRVEVTFHATPKQHAKEKGRPVTGRKGSD